MKSAKAKHNQGQSLVELLIAAAVFSLMVSAVVLAIIEGYLSDLQAGQNALALSFAEEGIEAARSIRDNNWNDLTLGTYGLTVSANHWVFQGLEEDLSPKLNQGKRVITIEDAGNNRKLVRSRVTWEIVKGKSAERELATYLTNWHITQAVRQADFLDINTTGARLTGGNQTLSGITFTNTGSTNIVVSKMMLTWTNTRLIERVTLGGTVVWSRTGPGTPLGRQPSGSELDIQDFTLRPGWVNSSAFRFNGNMRRVTFTITVTMVDGSTKTVENIQP